MPANAQIVSITSDWRTSGVIRLSADTTFHFVMVQARP
jgi:hypothetical protein